MKIVKFNNGQWGLEKGVLFKKYMSKHSRYWWGLQEALAVDIGIFWSSPDEIRNKVCYKVVERFPL